MKTMLVLAATLLLAATTLTSGQDADPAPDQPPTLLAFVATGDPAIGTPMSVSFARIGFLDTNGDGFANDAQPDEPFYFDVEGDYGVSFGDVRLTRFLNYPAGSSVDFTNRDFGHRLAFPGTSWVGRDASDRLFFDADGLRIVSPGDVRLTGQNSGTKVRLGDPEIGQALRNPQETVPAPARLGFADNDGDARPDIDEAIYLDTDGNRHVSRGDLRVARSAPAPDNDPTRTEFEALQEEQADQRARSGALAEEAAAVENRMNAWNAGLLLLGVLNGVGLVALAVFVRRLWRGERGPWPARGSQTGEHRTY